MNKYIDIVSINDLHGAFDGNGHITVKNKSKYPGIIRLGYEFNKIKLENKKTNGSFNNTIFVSAGDTFEGTGYSHLTKGEAIGSVLKTMNIKYSCVGNHDFDWGSEFLDINKQVSNDKKVKLFTKISGFSFLSCNVIDKELNQLVSWAKPYAIEKVDGIKIAILGLSSGDTAEVCLPIVSEQYVFLDPIQSIKQWVPIIKDEENPDVIIVLIHDGEGRNRNLISKIASQVSGVDAYITGHTHELYSKEVNDASNKLIPIVQAGSNAIALGKIRINYDSNTKKIISLNSSTITIDPEQDLKQLKSKKIYKSNKLFKKLKYWDNKIAVSLNHVLGTTAKDKSYTIDFSHGDFNSLSSAGQCVTGLLLRAVSDNFEKLSIPLPKQYQRSIDCALWNYGTIRSSIDNGDITLNTLYRVLPFEFAIGVARIKAKHLIQLFNEVYCNGLGYGYIQFYGITIVQDMKDKQNPFKKIISHENNKEFKDDDYISFVTNNGLLSGAGKAELLLQHGILKDTIIFENIDSRDTIRKQIELGYCDDINHTKLGVVDLEIKNILNKI